MELGQTICTKQSPDCKICPVQKQCKSFKAKSQTLAPKAKAKMVYKDVIMSIYVPIKNGKIGLQLRPKDSKFLKETWGFPTAIHDGKRLVWDGFNKSLSRKYLGGASVGAVKHSITNHKIEATVFPISDEFDSDLKWYSKGEVEENLLSNLDRKAWNKYLKSEHAL